MSRVYNIGTGIRQFHSLDWTVDSLGYSQTDIPLEYLVQIEDKRPDRYIENSGGKKIILIKAPLQEQFTTRTESTWSLLSAASLAQRFSELTQALTGRTLINRFANRQYWVGTTPLDFTLNLKFQAVNNARNEVLRPIIELQRMTLPFSGVTGSFTGEEGGVDWSKIAANTFLAPPGPDPFTVGGKSIRKKIPFLNKFKGISEDITIRVGSLLEIKRVVVKDIQVQHLPKFNSDGIPVEAIVTVHFQTFEIVTKETLDDIYKGSIGPTKPLEDQSLTGFAGTISKSIYGTLSRAIRRV